MTRMVNRLIPFSVIFDSDRFLLLGIRALYEYKDGRKTNTQLGYQYEVVDTTDFDKLTVKIKGQTEPLMPEDELLQLRGNGEKVFVSFVNGTDRLYTKRNGSSVTVEDSFSAEDIQLSLD